MAAATGMSAVDGLAIWRAFALAPHRSQIFKLSTDPLFIDKVRDVVVLYLDPPEKALVLCVDEKSQIQALGPVPAGPADDARGSPNAAATTTSGPAPPPSSPLSRSATGKVIGSLHRRHRAAEFKKFLTKLDKEVPADLQVHLILDNYATHKTPDIKKVAAGPSAVPPALHADQRVLAEPGGAVVRRADPIRLKRGVPPLRPGPRTRHPSLARRLERTPQTVRMDESRATRSSTKSPPTADESLTQITSSASLGVFVWFCCGVGVWPQGGAGCRSSTSSRVLEVSEDLVEGQSRRVGFWVEPPKGEECLGGGDGG
ncbi:hypothetical protein Shyd_73000 [Streptomyces hydrogenans]|uniref:Tc1-like transposase DDE domain-containing protein n=1 Tax=Streptomyces hydrogenans TaxID=1873719 RepID=A0ABQ3PLN1_9ACTN|nr:hypothetical protein Shyd_73000 [Streptomyces hydrogenans]